MSKAVKPKASSGSAKRKAEGFTDDERAAMKERAREVKSAARAKAGGEDEGAVALRAKIAELDPPDREMAERLHAIIMKAAPTLAPTTWYGMPAYAREAKVVCFFQPAQKFKTRYATLGFSDKAALDDGGLWPTAYAVKSLTAAEEARVTELVQRALR